MKPRILHIYRNTPLGRETLLQSLHFCRMLDLELALHVPRAARFMLYFEQGAVQVDLDGSYLSSPDTVEENLASILGTSAVTVRRLEVEGYTASTLPDLPTDLDYMCCPRIISDLSTKISLGQIGSGVRKILSHAHYPVLIPNSVHKPWNSVTVLYGGSDLAGRALRLGMAIAGKAGVELDVFSQCGPGGRQAMEDSLGEQGLLDTMRDQARQWRAFEEGDFQENLFAVPHDSLVVVGAVGHGLLKELVFGSKMELVQSTLTNNLLVVGPQFRPRHSHFVGN